MFNERRSHFAPYLTFFINASYFKYNRKERYMRTRSWLVLLLLGPVLTVRAELIWSENFTNVSAWSVVSDPSGGSTITSDGIRASLYVNANDSLAAFAPAVGLKPMVEFNQANKSAYSMSFSVEDLTWSLSYDVALDQFDASSNYLSTVWQVFPIEFTSTFVGSTNINLGGYSFDASCVYVMPKITVHTGDGGQTVRFNSMSFDVQVVPEAGTAALCIMGILALLARPLARRRIRK
jgi:hypothetical protein